VEVRITCPPLEIAAFQDFRQMPQVTLPAGIYGQTSYSICSQTIANCQRCPITQMRKHMVAALAIASDRVGAGALLVTGLGIDYL